MAHNADERNRIEAILRSKPLTFEQVKELRRKAEKNGTPIVLPGANDAAVDAEGDLLLDGFFLVFLIMHCNVIALGILKSMQIYYNYIFIIQYNLHLFNNPSIVPWVHHPLV